MVAMRPTDVSVRRVGGCYPVGAASAPGKVYALSSKMAASARKNPSRALNGYRPKANPDMMQDSDGEEMQLCPQCRLPIGSFGFANSRKTALLHGECKAQIMLREAKEDHEARQRSDAALKQKERTKYSIGWKPEMIPCSLPLARKLVGQQISQGMCCLVLEGSTVHIAPTVDPAACVNLEYLSLALQVRRQEGREPVFSLDMNGLPTSKSNEPEDLWQVKRFEPAWLGGTSVGEVMFQADYHLKELSMGGSEQPVVGMLSAFDLAKEEWRESDWRAREWFVVKQAGICKSEGNVLIPQVRMGVEAREQTSGAQGLEDCVVTRREHPLVKYAEAFTQYFDLIAERRSCIYHLRELAKASVLAKYLMDAQVNLEDAWFDPMQEQKQMYRVEIPQLWNQRSYSQVTLKDGKILGAEQGISIGTHGVYGGVGFGLDKVDLGATTMQPGAGEAPYSLLFSAAERGAVMARGVVTPPSLMEPRGVDLDLSRFDLSETSQATEAGAASIGKAFWSSVASADSKLFKDEDKHLLREVFNPSLSDRRDEGDLFVPPNPRAAYLDELRQLVETETQIRKQRAEHFFSGDFIAGAAGPLFPPSWTNSFDSTQASLPAIAVRCTQLDEQVDQVKSTAPVFDMSCEDGTRYRIYCAQSLEVRTVQERDAEEAVGAVFSSAALCSTSASDSRIANDAKITKAVEYVEGTELGHHYYVVLETETSGSVTVEQLANGSVAFVENAEGLAARKALAKVTRCAELGGEASIGAVRAAASAPGGPASSSQRKRFAREIFQRASLVEA